MGLASDFALLHAAERLVATHKAALAEVEPLLSLTRKLFDDGDGAVSRTEFVDAIKSELSVLEGHHQCVKDAVDDVRSLLPDASAEA